MRRQEFQIDQPEELESFLAGMTFGFLGTVDGEGRPRVTPLNFVYADGAFYFHGSHAGSKMKDIRSRDAVTFSVADEVALIPSYFTDPSLACPATAYFKSVTARGRAETVTDLAEKARALSLFMAKLQPQGGYDPITTEDPRYRPQLKAVSVVRIDVEELTAKFKFGQNLQEDEREAVIGGLVKREGARDEETIALMKKYCPYHSS
ncbi:pyridoxamine 5'-phosphate oxidase family protein [Paenibacillus glufosinatiresistens]|uniref:pyridoxamine 5'-phosphate oxidase family protein n=1 Tax=Paenibacillus glufosinatiresistens TaxID=3070657 RepID=UPI00286DAA40|nr:pyridoxamine 5'-phosphate oxidase family protein [Paenibacillus sp. YX.27]